MALVNLYKVCIVSEYGDERLEIEVNDILSRLEIENRDVVDIKLTSCFNPDMGDINYTACIFWRC